MATEEPRRGHESTLSEGDFTDLVDKNFPSWNAVWNLLLETDRENRRASASGASHPPARSPSDLQARIRRKIAELVDEEEVLASLYEKAARVAREREEELRDKSAILMRQIAKDKNLMRTLKNLS